MKKLRVTDHAAMRFLECGVGFDIEMLKRSVSDALDNAFQAGVKLGVSNFLILSGGEVYVVRDGALVTVVPDDGRRHHLLDSKHAGPKEGQGS